MIYADNDTIIARLQELAQEMTETAVIMQHKYPEKAQELFGAAGLVTEWVEGIRGNTLTSTNARLNMG